MQLAQKYKEIIAWVAIGAAALAVLSGFTSLGA